MIVDADMTPHTRVPGWSTVEIVDGMVRVPPPDVLPPRFPMRAPLLKRNLTARPIAVIEAEIRRATVPALRPEDV